MDADAHEADATDSGTTGIGAQEALNAWLAYEEVSGTFPAQDALMDAEAHDADGRYSCGYRFGTQDAEIASSASSACDAEVSKMISQDAETAYEAVAALSAWLAQDALVDVRDIDDVGNEPCQNDAVDTITRFPYASVTTTPFC